MWNKLVWMVLVAGALCGCKVKKVVVVAPPADATNVPGSKKAENLALLKKNDLAFTTLALKGKASLDINGNTNNVNMNIRMKKGEMIWISVTAIAGIEVARVLITPVMPTTNTQASVAIPSKLCRSSHFSR